MNQIIRLLVLLLLMVGYAATDLFAQPESRFGPWVVGGSLTAGYRSTSTLDGSGGESDWADKRYWEALNFRTGGQLSAFDLFARKANDASSFFDEAFITLQGIGEPFTNGRLRVRAFNSYDLNVQYRRAEFYLDRNDSLYNALHKYDMSREILNARLNVELSDVLGVTAHYDGTGRSGNLRNTHSPLVEATGYSTVESYARENFFFVDVPRTDWTNDIGLDANLHFEDLSITLGGGYRDFNELYSASPYDSMSINYRRDSVSANNAGILRAGNARGEFLHDYLNEEDRSRTTTYFTAQIVSKPLDMLTITAQGRYDMTRGTLAIEGHQSGLMRKSSGSAVRLYRSTTHGEGGDTVDNLMASIMARGNLMKGLDLVASLRYEQVDQRTGVEYKVTFDTSTNMNPVYRSTIKDSIGHFGAETHYKIPVTRGQVHLNYAPIHEFSIRGGLQFYNRSPEASRSEEGEADSAFAANLSKALSRTTPFVNVVARPMEDVTIRGSFSMINDNWTLFNSSTETSSLIRLLPEEVQNYGISFDVTPVEDLDLGLGLNYSTGTSTFEIPNTLNRAEFLPGTTLDDKTLRLNASVGYGLTERTSISLTGEYRQDDIELPVQFTRGTKTTTPQYGVDSLVTKLAENTIDRYVDLQITSEEIDNLTIRVGTSYLRSTGSGSMTEPSLGAPAVPDYVRNGGPYSWIGISALLGYNFTENLGVEVDGRWVSLDEDVVRAADGRPRFAGLNSFTASVVRGSLRVRF